MAFVINKASREQIYAKIALMGPSGSGKSYSALRLATGMLEEMKRQGQDVGNGKILLANTEGSRGRYYANEFSYDIVDIGAPHNPEKYVELIEFVNSEKYPILIMDSTSQEWEGKGGCLDLHQQAGGTFQSWGKVTPRHDKFIQAIADSKLHLIATMRGKDQYEIEKSDSGKQNVKKLGVGAQQRNGFEYEFTATFSIDQKSNMATVQKDNTHIFENEGEVRLSEDFGRKIIVWASSGEGYTPPVRETKSPTQEAEANMEKLKSDVMTISKKLVENPEIGKEKYQEVLFKYTNGKPNPNVIKDPATMNELYIHLKQLENKEN